MERIVSALERGDVALDKSIEIYERGEALKKHCEALLKAAEDRIEKIRLDRAPHPACRPSPQAGRRDKRHASVQTRLRDSKQKHSVSRLPLPNRKH